MSNASAIAAAVQVDDDDSPAAATDCGPVPHGTGCIDDDVVITDVVVFVTAGFVAEDTSCPSLDIILLPGTRTAVARVKPWGEGAAVT